MDFLNYSESLPASSVLQWTDLVEHWEADPMQINPFVPTIKSELR